MSSKLFLFDWILMTKSCEVLCLVCTIYFCWLMTKIGIMCMKLSHLHRVEQKAVMGSQGKKQMDLDTSCLEGTGRQIQT